MLWTPRYRVQQMQADKTLVGSNAFSDPSPCSLICYSMQVSVTTVDVPKPKIGGFVGV
jgi:hypothetical protein